MSTPLQPPETIDPSARIISLHSQYPADLLGVPTTGLRLTWQAEAQHPQLGYQLRWRGDEGARDVVAEPVVSDASIGVLAPGPAPHPGEIRRYAVRLATESGWSPWSDEIEIESALDPAALDAVPIGGSSEVQDPVILLRTEFVLPATPVRARLHAAFWGVGELRINGRRAVEEHLTPGWTAYQDRIVVGTWDVTGLLHAGDNALGSLLGDGWYRGRLGWEDGIRPYGLESAALIQLDVECEDGSSVRVASSTEWQASTGAVRSASLYDGVEVDLRQKQEGWDTSGFDSSGWARARRIDVDTAVLEPRITSGVRTVAEWPVEVQQRSDRVFLDLGQNVAGWLRLNVRGNAGDRVEVRHAEVLEKDGSIHTAALRTARATDGYVLAEDGEVTLEPTFTFHGFQYAEVTGAEVLSATAVAISSADRVRSAFTTSDYRLARLHSNVAWSQRDNFVSLPTDCPQRDERLGWTGDAQAFAPTASTLFDVESFWISWLRDLELDQAPDGAVPAVVPNILTGPEDLTPDGWITMGRAGWADAATFVPWAVYESYGSTEVLERQLGSMRRWVASLEARAEGGLLPTEFQFGDWLDPDAPGDEPWKAKVSSDYVANAFFARSAWLLAEAERLVGDGTRSRDARALAERVAGETWRRWGEEAVRTQTGAAIAIEFSIAPASEHARIGDGLARNVRAEEGRIATGFLGTPLVLFALARTGHLDEAYRMLLRQEPPSWLYQVEMGATTVWERWDALSPDGTIHSGDMADGGNGMLSFNHYAYGAVVDWIYRFVAGIAPDPDRPGYRRITVAPRPAIGLDRASASIESRLGEVSIDWRLGGGELTIDLKVPYGAEAVLDLPVSASSVVVVDGDTWDGSPVRPGRHEISVSAPLVASPE